MNKDETFQNLDKSPPDFKCTDSQDVAAMSVDPAACKKLVPQLSTILPQVCGPHNPNNPNTKYNLMP